MVALPQSEIVGIVAGIVASVDFPIYIWACLRKKTVPHPFTWITSALLAGVFLLTYNEAGAEDTIFVPLGDFVGLSAIALVAIFLSLKGGAKKGVREWVRSFDAADWLTAGGAVIAIVLYCSVNDPLYKLVAVLAAEVMALWPTIRKTWHRPHEEDFLAWSFTCGGNLLNFFAMQGDIPAEMIYVWTIFIVDLSVWLLILRGMKGGKKTGT